MSFTIASLLEMIDQDRDLFYCCSKFIVEAEFSCHESFMWRYGSHCLGYFVGVDVARLPLGSHPTLGGRI